MNDRTEFALAVEKLILAFCTTTPYRAKVAAGAMYDVLKETGWINPDKISSSTVEASEQD